MQLGWARFGLRLRLQAGLEPSRGSTTIEPCPVRYSRRPSLGLMLLVASRNAAFACAAVTETPGALPSTVRTPELLSAAVIMATETLTPDRDSCFRTRESTLTFFFETTAAARAGDRTFYGSGEYKLFHCCLHVLQSPNLSSPSFLH